MARVGLAARKSNEWATGEEQRIWSFLTCDPHHSSRSQLAAMSSSTTRLDLNRPRPIFLGWTALIFVAGFGYYYAKQSNLAKRKEIMRAGGETGTNGGQGEQTASAAEGRGGRGGAAGERSPLQALIDQVNRQTSQRRRADD